MRMNHKTRNLLKYVRRLPELPTFWLGLRLNEVSPRRLAALGLPESPVAGSSVLPPAIGPASRRNANGFQVVHRNRSKETASRTVEWRWTEHHGRDEIERTDWRDVSYERYPRTNVLPYAIELVVMRRKDGEMFLAAGPFQARDDDEARITNTGNMLIEQIGEFDILDPTLSSWSPVAIRRLNWDLLPPGEHPWKSLLPQIEATIRTAKKGNQSFIRARLEKVGSYEPACGAVGRGGFKGYVAFFFPAHGLCVLENATVNNATYVLRLDEWEHLARMSKAEILNGSRQVARLVHTKSWFLAIDGLLNSGTSMAA